ncbi:MAG: glucuronate isomerase, partial [Elusimicrobiota bacterium]|nr:glucuronate isomerase [Elusimicrobiota bacterium]
CHINPKEIAQDRKFENITQLWLGGDHYKWRLMRANGIAEKFITGNGSDEEKFHKWAQTLERAIGNPLYHWSHLELQRYFDYKKPLGEKTWRECWQICNEKLQSPSMSARKIIERSNVKLICTTDDPADSLRWHQQIRDDKTFNVKVLPAWRPDQAMCIEKPAFLDYLKTLSAVSSVEINSFASLKEALIKRLDFFASLGAKASDHGPDFVYFYPADEAEIEGIFAARLAGKNISKLDELKFKTAFLLFSAKQYHRLGWVMQLHFSCKRDNNTRALQTLGINTGYDCINNLAPGAQIADFLNELDKTNQLPKTILYSLNPNDDDMLNTIANCFQSEGVLSKVQQGSAWWFNDHLPGMKKQMIAVASSGMLANFVGMLTDSRSFISYPRHEYFRRILCDLIGGWVESGQYPNDLEALGKIVEDISYNNVVNFFGFQL